MESYLRINSLRKAPLSLENSSTKVDEDTSSLMESSNQWI